MKTGNVDEKIRREIRKRVVERHFHVERKKEASEKYEALLAALEDITDLPPDEIRRIADEAQDEYPTGPEKPASRAGPARWIFGAVAAALLILAGVFFLLRQDMAPFDRRIPERGRDARTAEAPGEHPEPVPKAPEQSPKRRKRPAWLPPEAEPVMVSIGKDGFRPIGMKMRVGGQDTGFFSGEIPEEIVRMPRFKGNEQKYGVLRLGVMENNRFPFAFDLLPDGRPEMYVDINQNGDLTDDGGPRVNEGTGWFGAAVWIPFDRLAKAARLPGKYRTWLFMKENDWNAGVFKRYSWTQLQGTVSIAGQEYVAYIADHGEHDADYANDPIGVDLNRDGKIDYDAELFPSGALARVGGRRYGFVIEW